jgi:hypothetical protein
MEAKRKSYYDSNGLLYGSIDKPLNMRVVTLRISKTSPSDSKEVAPEAPTPGRGKPIEIPRPKSVDVGPMKKGKSPLAGKTGVGRIGNSKVTMKFQENNELVISGELEGKGRWTATDSAVYLETQLATFRGTIDKEKVSGLRFMRGSDGSNVTEWSVDLQKEGQQAQGIKFSVYNPLDQETREYDSYATAKEAAKRIAIAGDRRISSVAVFVITREGRSLEVYHVWAVNGHEMDAWQLCQLAMSLVLPLRPDEAAGLLIGDVNFDRSWLEFGERMKGTNPTKGRTSFVVPFSDPLRPILRACIGGRIEGPLLRSRKAFAVGSIIQPVRSLEHLNEMLAEDLHKEPADAVQADQDRKLVFRRLLRRLGGVTEDALRREFKALLYRVNVPDAKLYSLRSSVTTGMHRAGLPHLELRYLTGHSTNDILNTYTSLDPVGAMNKYFDSITPLLSAIALRSSGVGVALDEPRDVTHARPPKDHDSAKMMANKVKQF